MLPHDLKDFKIHYAQELIKRNYEEIVIREHRILAREESLKSLPDTPDKKIQETRKAAEIEKFKDDIHGLEYNIEILEKLIIQYK